MASIRSALTVAALTCAGLASAFAKTGADDAPLPAVTLDSCSWNRPGVNPFMGDVVAAVDRYTDIPAEVRARLKGRMARRQYDDIVAIRRDSIDGRAGNQYGSTIRDMHFGTRQLCRSVTRAAWTAGMQERGLVYCEGGQCILVPTVCRNVSRISRKAVDAEHAEAPDEADPLAVVPPGAVPADALAVPATPLALDEAPSFARPAAWGGPLADGVVPGAGAPDGLGVRRHRARRRPELRRRRRAGRGRQWCGAAGRLRRTAGRAAAVHTRRVAGRRAAGADPRARAADLGADAGGPGRAGAGVPPSQQGVRRDVGGAVAGAVCAAGRCRAGACADPAQAASD